MNLVWTRSAAEDRSEIRGWIAERNPLAAIALDELFSEKAGLLAEHPYSGRPGRVVGTHELVVHPNYMLVYDVVGEQVRVLSVVHTARQWPPAGENQR